MIFHSFKTFFLKNLRTLGHEGTSGHPKMLTTRLLFESLEHERFTFYKWIKLTGHDINIEKGYFGIKNYVFVGVAVGFVWVHGDFA